MFTAKTQDYELTINCDPDEFTWKKYFPETGRYMYKYPDVPEFVTDYQIFMSEKHTPAPEAPECGQQWVILKTDWTINGIEDDFFDMKVGDIIEVADVEQYDDSEGWSAMVIVDDRMTLQTFSTGDKVTFFTDEHMLLKVIARYK